MSRLSIVHWNDVYRVTPQKITADGDTIDVTQFAALLDDIRRKWRVRSDGARDGLSLFSGDLFSPSVESTVTRGSHMVPVMNELAPDVALTGNHDFDFGYPHLSKLVDDTKFDIQLATDLLASSPSAQKNRSIAGEHGVDIILGGHDHLYFASKGVTTWDGYDVSKPSIGSEGDDGDILVVKSGTDFRELSELTLELEDTPPGSIRKKVIKAVHGKRHKIQPGMPSSKNLQKILHDILSSVSESLKAPVCITEVALDLRSYLLRTDETAAGNWFADVLRHAYDDALSTKCGSGSDGVLICAGTLRGDTLYSPGVITLGNILEILPFDDPTVVLELDGETLWDALEGALSTYPAQEGRFPIVSGLRVSWDSRRPSGQRVLGVWLLQEVPKTSLENSRTSSSSGTPALVDGESIKREKNGRTYKIVTREYMATGHDGYTALLGHEYLIDDEDGQLMSSLVRKYLLGGHYVNKMVHLREKNQETNHLHSETAGVVQRWQHAAVSALHKLRSRVHYMDHFNITAREHMSGVDCCDGKRIRRGSSWNGKSGHEKTYNDDLLAIHPVVDGRFQDVARS
ncbi:Metallo-dependent phosphatase [Butyriboletus roseoflavus]|nr:Metallo-dependent phosphatase [Butyriboletus roseoflavus]